MDRDESTVNKVLDFVLMGESPLEKWLDLGKQNLAELHIFHMAYGWMFIQDLELMEMNYAGIDLYVKNARNRFLNLIPDLQEEAFLDLFKDRMSYLKEELRQIRATRGSDIPYFPAYFYQRICHFPLELNDLHGLKFSQVEWSSAELRDMFCHQINYLEDKLHGSDGIESDSQKESKGVGLFQNGHTCHTGAYKCVSCDHSTIIFVDTEYSLFNCMETYKVCSSCNEEKEILSDGDTIMRYDWPDADDDPWQPQCAHMLDEDRYCTDCRDEVPIIDDWRKMVVACSKCDSYMKFNE